MNGEAAQWEKSFTHGTSEQTQTDGGDKTKERQFN